MTTMNNFVAVDWRNGPDRIFFFFKDTCTYSRFDLGNNKVPENYPTAVGNNWQSFGQHVKDLRFGFNTSGIAWDLSNDSDMLWLFYYDGPTPMVCKYRQMDDKVYFKKPLSHTVWALLSPYFDRIVGVMWYEQAETKHTYWVLMNDGNYLIYNPWKGTVKIRPIKGSMWSGLEQYKDRMITAVLNDHPTTNTFFYIFLTNNEYLRFDFNEKNIVGPIPVDDASWRGLI